VDLTKYDIIVVSSSSGKDSQVMLDQVSALADIQGVLDRVIVVHSDLGRLEWDGAPELAEEQADFYDVRFKKVSRIGTISDGVFNKPNVVPLYARGEARGDLLDQVRHRSAQLNRLNAELRGLSRFEFAQDLERYISSKKVRGLEKEYGSLDDLPPDVLEGLYQRRLVKSPPWYSPASRYCTADFKRGPILAYISRLVEDWREDNGWPRKGSRGEQCWVLDCQGLRAEESPGRKKKPVFQPRKVNKRIHMDTWLPIHGLTEVEVWDIIRESGAPYHPAYDIGLPEGSSANIGSKAWARVRGKMRKVKGMPRLSCVFCFYSPTPGLVLAAREGQHLCDPDLLDDHIAVEDETGFTFKPDLSLREVREMAEDPNYKIDPITGDWNM